MTDGQSLQQLVRSQGSMEELAETFRTPKWEVDIILCQRTFLSAVRIQKRCRAIFGKHHEWTFNTCLRTCSAGLLVCRAKKRFGSGFAASDTQTGFSTDPMPEVPPGVDQVHNLSADVHTGRISRSFVSYTEKYSGSPDAERSSLNEGTRSGGEPLTRTGYGGCQCGGGTHEVFN